MHKILGIIFAILGVVAVVGAIVYFLALVTLGQVIGTASADPTIAQQAGVDAQGLADVLGLLSTLIILAWLWGIAVLISGIASFWFGLRILRRKAK